MQEADVSPFNTWEWLASKFSQLYDPCITQQGHENKGNDHQLNIL